MANMEKQSFLAVGKWYWKSGYKKEMLSNMKKAWKFAKAAKVDNKECQTTSEKSRRERKKL